jgi:hypothetical protein
MQSKQDQKLEEVRAILQRLQRISAGAEEDELPPPSIVTDAQPKRNGSALHGAAPHSDPAPAMSAEKTIAAIAVPVFIALGAAGWMLWSLGGDEASESPPARVAGPQTVVPPATGVSAQSKAQALSSPVAEPQKTAAMPAPRPPSAAVTPAQRQSVDPVATVPPVAVAPVNPDAERLAIAQRLIDKGKISEARRVLKNDLASRNAEAALLLARSYDPNSLQLIANPDAGAEPAEAERWYRRWSELAAGQGLELDRERLDRIIKAMR